MTAQTASRAEAFDVAALAEALVAAEKEGYLTLAEFMSAREVAARLTEGSESP